MALERRGIFVNSQICSSCIGNSECADHVLINCPFAIKIRSCIWRWCGIAGDHESVKTICELIDFASKWGRNKKERKRFVVICYGMIWNLWRFRNKRLFHCESTSVQNGVECIKAMTFVWVKHRSRNGMCSWEDWGISPFYDV
ncbi:hypothetical protein Lser_V15G09275 [Lactuca serriola]